MKLSVIIVNYNVRHFLDTCLQSVLKACQNIEAEIIVVDNNSQDDSIDMLKMHYPQVRLLANSDNAGFSKANNQAMDVAKGEYMLLLNPDTVVPEDCFVKCIEYMDTNKDTGGLGVKMIDGSGRFLPESKRGLPTPVVAFYKIFGLSRMFPKSKRFGKYHLGYLDKDKTHEVDILSGAFMLLRKSLINEIGGLDEAFFMYGEDIDLSYRIIKSGNKNVYFPEAPIIHFKGESTKKSSVNYVLVFYRAMIIFAKKHFNNPNARVFSLLINLAVYLRAFLAIFKRITVRLLLPVFDIAMIWILLEWLTGFYEVQVHGTSTYYPEEIHYKVIPIMALSWSLCQYVLGGYLQPIRMKSVVKGLMAGAVLVFIIYAMLDESLRFSRGVVTLSILVSTLSIPLLRILLNKLGWIRLMRFMNINSGIVGSPECINSVKEILSASSERKKNLHFIDPIKKSEFEKKSDIQYVGSIYQLMDIIQVYKLDEIIFCLQNVAAKDIIEIIQRPMVRNKNIYLRPEYGDYILRSSSIHSIGEFIKAETNPEMTSWSKKRKRLLDVMLSLVLIVFWPLASILLRSPLQYIENMLAVLIGKMTFVGSGKQTKDAKPYLFTIFTDSQDQKDYGKEKKYLDYMVNYSIIKDLDLIFSGIGNLDSQPNKIT